MHDNSHHVSLNESVLSEQCQGLWLQLWPKLNLCSEIIAVVSSGLAVLAVSLPIPAVSPMWVNISLTEGEQLWWPDQAQTLREKRRWDGQQTRGRWPHFDKEIHMTRIVTYYVSLSSFCVVSGVWFDYSKTDQENIIMATVKYNT